MTDTTPDTVVRTDVRKIALVPNPEKKTGQEIAELLLTELFADALFSWFLKVGLRTVHSVKPSVPAPGYWACVKILYMINAIGVALRGTKRVIST